MAESTQLPFPKLENNNFSNWKFRVLSLLEAKKVKNVTVENIDVSSLKEKDQEKFHEKDALARSLIISCLTDKHLEYVRSASTAYEMMKNLQNVFERKSVLSRLYVRRKLLQLKCKHDTELQDHFVVFDSLIRDLESTGSKMDEDDKVCHLLLTMPDEYETVITVLETTNEKLTLEFVKSKLLDAELKHRNSAGHLNKGNGNDECSFSARFKPRCYACGSYQHLRDNCPGTKAQQNSPSFSKPRENFRQNRRPRGNHFGSRQGFIPRQQGNHGACALTHNEPYKDDVSFIAFLSELDLENDQKTVSFVLDSGATNNLFTTSLAKYMKQIEDIEPVHIKIANGSVIVARQQGIIRVRCVQTHRFVSIEGLIVDDLPYNLLSVRKINAKGYKVLFEENGAKILIDQTPIVCELRRNLFVVKFLIDESSCLIAEEPDDVWHMRLCHLNRRGLQLLKLPYSDGKCDSCEKGKSKRRPFKPSTKPRSSRVGELLHTDVCGPIQTPGLNGEKYYVSILDDFSHFSVAYYMKNKSETEQNLVNHIRKLNSSGIKVARIRMDKGGEYMSNSFRKFCLEMGIRQEFTAGYTPQQSGCAERLNRTIFDKVRTMFVDTHLPKNLWCEAVSHAVHALNRSPSKAIDNQVPAQIYLSNLNLDRLRIFGAKAWYLKLPKQGKLEPRGREARMVGYSGAGYRLWDPELNEIIISRDVTFDEKNFKFKQDLNEEKTSTVEPVQNRLQLPTASVPETPFEETNDPDREIDRPPERSERRKIKPPTYLSEYEVYYTYCLITAENDPQTYDEAIGRGNEWKQAIQNELSALEKFNTWDVADIPADKKLIDTKWVFRTKQDGRKKARLVVKGYQEDSIANLYAPVAKLPTIRMFLCHALQNDLELRQLDVPNAFLNGCLKSEVYIKFPRGVDAKKGKALKLKRALYGLKEAPRVWNERFDEFAAGQGLLRSKTDACLYVNDGLWVVLFVDDCLVTGRPDRIAAFVKAMKDEFNAKDLGNLSCFLGMDIERDKHAMRISQKPFINRFLERFNFDGCRGSPTPMEAGHSIDPTHPKIDVPYREVIGCLNYLATTSRPDLTFSTSYLGRFLDNPTEAAWKSAKRILRYVKGTQDLYLEFTKTESPKEDILLAYADSDWGSDTYDRKSVSGIAIFFYGNLISWSSKKQPTVSLSSAESEYYAASSCAAELLYLRNLVLDFTKIDTCPRLLMDNQSAIFMANNYENSRRAKHIEIKVHFIRDVIAKGQMKTDYVPSSENIADILTKALPSVPFARLRKMMKIC
ncbi:Hypothetical protein2 [Nesidiocoris tenuis]|uniref:Endonuclease n=1 Tax=Nesidiocoris tenuis TaxID=355587 RepID=A0ABN7B9R3_9HEMI|nr:Hypothetical protein2 [Nesidiocoris tenuis]